MDIKDYHQKMEESARETLQDSGYSIKYRKPFGRPDILATHRGRTVAVEVKVSPPTIADVARVCKFRAHHRVVYTESTPTPSGVAFAEELNVIIGGANELREHASKWAEETTTDMRVAFVPVRLETQIRLKARRLLKWTDLYWVLSSLAIDILISIWRLLTRQKRRTE